MNILLTGASGMLGSYISKILKKSHIKFISFNQNMELSEVNWNDVTHVINCAAVVPGANKASADYWAGNINFLESLIRFSNGKHFIHFSSLSELYKFDTYQVTKMIGNNLLNMNKHVFSSLDIVIVPTLNDEDLISSIIDKANDFQYPVVDALEYSFIDVEHLAELVVQGITQKTSISTISKFKVKNLYDEVTMRISNALVVKGNYINRTCVEEQIFTSHNSLFSIINKLL